MIDHTAIILAGGAARRLGGAAKPRLRIEGVSLLSRAVNAARLAGCRDIVVVGPADPEMQEVDGVEFVQEDPPRGGPAAALTAALPRVTTGWVLLLAADVPRAPEAVALLDIDVEADADAGREAASIEGVCLVDSRGRRQHLLARYRTASLRARSSALGDSAGTSMQRLLAGLRLYEVHDDSGRSRDVDTWEDVWTARIRGGIMPASDAPLPPEALDAWAASLADRFDLRREDIPIALVLDLARDVAHGVARPAAPLSAFVAGFVAGRHGGSQTDIESAVKVVVEMARGWRVS